jgi:hypothetical protein
MMPRGIVRLARPLSVSGRGEITINQPARHAASFSCRLDRSEAARARSTTMAISGSGRETDAWVHLWTVQVKERLARRWPAVEAVAGALMKDLRINGSTITALLNNTKPMISGSR